MCDAKGSLFAFRVSSVACVAPLRFASMCGEAAKLTRPDTFGKSPRTSERGCQPLTRLCQTLGVSHNTPGVSVEVGGNGERLRH